MSALLSLESIRYEIGGDQILQDINLSVGAGEFIGLIGPNGAGKTTLLRIAAGLEQPAAGKILLGATQLSSLSISARAQHISYLPQAREIAWSITARELVSLGRFAWGAPMQESPEDDAAISHALEETGADAFANRLAHTLSGGELARVHLARALAARTPLFLADEPVAALDPAHQLSVMKLLRAKADGGCAVIAALHELPLAARHCTRLIVLKKGVVAADGRPAEVITPAIMRNVFEVDAIVETQNGVLCVHLAPAAN